MLSVYLFLKVARHILPTAAVPMALGFFVISEPLIYYCTEAKRYAVAILATLALFNLIFSLHNKDLSLRQAIIFGVSGSMILWFSFHLSSLLGGIGLSVLCCAVAQRVWPHALYISIARVLGLISFLLCYVLSMSYYHDIVDMCSSLFIQRIHFPPSEFNWIMNLGDFRKK